MCGKWGIGRLKKTMACSSFISLLVKHAEADVCGAIALGHPECDQHGERAA